MGRAINMENDISVLRTKVERLETAFEGLASTVETLQDTAPTKKNIDIHKEVKKGKKRIVEDAEV